MTYKQLSKAKGELYAHDLNATEKMVVVKHITNGAIDDQTKADEIQTFLLGWARVKNYKWIERS